MLRFHRFLAITDPTQFCLVGMDGAIPVTIRTKGDLAVEYRTAQMSKARIVTPSMTTASSTVFQF